MITVQETTKWPGNIPNHKYILSDDGRTAYGYIKNGERLPQLFSSPVSIDWRGRSYKVVVRTKDPDPNVRSWKISGSKGNVYIVSQQDGHFSCTCPAAMYRHAQCKHIEHVKERIALEEATV